MPPYIGDINIYANESTLTWGDELCIYAEVGGNDIPTSVSWTLEGNTAASTSLNNYDQEGRKSQVTLHVSDEERSSLLTVRATSVKDPAKFADFSIMIIPWAMAEPVNITYDKTMVPLDTLRSGNEVSRLLFAAVTST